MPQHNVQNPCPLDLARTRQLLDLRRRRFAPTPHGRPGRECARMRWNQPLIFHPFQNPVAIVSRGLADTSLGFLEAAFTERVGLGQAAEFVEEGVVVDVVDPGVVEGFGDVRFVGGGGREGGDQTFCAAESRERVDGVGAEGVQEGGERGLDGSIGG